jgi:hypothetical protein
MLPMPLQAYWRPLEAILAVYVRDNYHKSIVPSGQAERPHINVIRLRDIRKESNDLDENMSGSEKPEYIEHTKNRDFRE